MTSVALGNEAPYKTCITHGFVVDKDTRKKVSKSAQGTYTKPMDAAHFVGKYGADIVRLWASSVEFTNEVPFSEESFALLADAYRQFRNVLRILLANSNGRPGDLAGATLVDRWLRSRLQEVIGVCREAYAAFDFRKVFQTLNQFCTVDLSALYVDITKDRLYCDAAESPRRRATQAVMGEAFEAVSALLAPILAFTTDEAWEFAGREGSIHLELFPQPDESARDAEAESQVEGLLKLRGVIAQAIEPARQQKLIGNALEANVTLRLSEAAQFVSLRGLQAELEEFFILSELHIDAGAETAASLVRTEYGRCERCWRHRPYVGKSAAHPDLCDRCEEVVGGMGR
jgi:isoleucyl-tRNA synthetase